MTSVMRWMHSIKTGLLCALLTGGSVHAQRHFGSTHRPCTHQACGKGLEAIPVDANSHIPAPAWFTLDAPRDASIIVNYNGFPSDAIIAFNHAVDIWSVIISSSVTIRIDATWEELGSGALAQAAPTSLQQNFPNAPLSDTYYAVALANALAGEDQSEQSDVTCSFSSTANWYFGTDGDTPAGAYDFVTAALHEIAHGIGFIGSAYYTEGFGFIGTANTPYPYDYFTETADSVALLSLPNGSQTLGTALTSNAIYWNGAGGIEGVGGGRPHIYAPSNYSVGSSYSHLNESTYPAGSPNSLMTPGLNTAESNHDPGPALLGMFSDIGWEIGGCEIVDVVLGEQSPCNSESDTYSQALVLSYQGAPNEGLISVNGELFSLTTSPQTLVLTGLPSNGLSVDLDILFPAEPTCNTFIPDAFTAPAACYCLADLSGNGWIEVQDLLLLLADFGCLVGCLGDVTGDGASNVEDVLAVLSAFGNDCP